MKESQTRFTKLGEKNNKWNNGNESAKGAFGCDRAFISDFLDAILLLFLGCFARTVGSGSIVAILGVEWGRVG